MTDLIWQQKINKVIMDTLVVPKELPELGRVTSVNVYPEVNRGEIYRGSLVVEGVIKCEIFYATPAAMSSEAEQAGVQEGPDWAQEMVDESSDDEVFPEEELWGADDTEPDPELEKEPIYCLYHNLVYRVPVEIPKREAGQRFEFVPGVSGVDYQIIDNRKLEVSVNLNLDLAIQGLSVQPVEEPVIPIEEPVVIPSEVTESMVEAAEADPAAEEVTEVEVDAPAEILIPALEAESIQQPAVDEIIPDNEVGLPVEEAIVDPLDELLDQAVKEIGQGVEAVFAAGVTTKEEEPSEDLAVEAEETTLSPVIPEGTVEESLIDDVVEVFATEEDNDDEINEEMENAAAPEQSIEPPSAEEIREAAENEAAHAAEEIAKDFTDVVMKQLEQEQGTLIKFNGKKELQKSVGFQSQKLVPTFKITFTNQ